MGAYVIHYYFVKVGRDIENNINYSDVVKKNSNSFEATEFPLPIDIY